MNEIFWQVLQSPAYRHRHHHLHFRHTDRTSEFLTRLRYHQNRISVYKFNLDDAMLKCWHTFRVHIKCVVCIVSLCLSVCLSIHSNTSKNSNKMIKDQKRKTDENKFQQIKWKTHTFIAQFLDGCTKRFLYY